MNGKIIEIRDGQNWKRLGKIARRSDSDVLIFTADVDPAWRDPYVEGWSINWVVYTTLTSDAWQITALFLYDKVADSTYFATTATWAEHMLAGGVSSWGQNVTLLDEHWNRWTGRPPSTAWIDDAHPGAILRLEPRHIPREVLDSIGQVLTIPSDELAKMRATIDEKIREASLFIWTDPLRRDALLGQAYNIWKKIVKARGGSHGSYTDFERWLRQGAKHTD